MAKDVDVTTEAQVVGYDAEQFAWETVHTEQADLLTFDSIGDTLIATYLGAEVITFTAIDKKTKEETEESFTQLHFMLPGNNPINVNAGYDLEQAFKNIPTQSMVRVQLMKLVDVGQQSEMKSYRVDVAAPVALPAIV